MQVWHDILTRSWAHRDVSMQAPALNQLSDYLYLLYLYHSFIISPVKCGPSVMKKTTKQEEWQGIAYFACAGVLWIHLDDFGASEFSLTGKLFAMAHLGFELFLVALLLTDFFPRVAAAFAFTAALLCLPFYLYIVLPEPYRQILKGEYSLPIQRQSVWNNWAALGIFSLGVAGVLSLSRFFKGRAHA